MTVGGGERTRVLFYFFYLGQSSAGSLSEKVAFDHEPNGGREPWRHWRIACLICRIAPD